MGEGRYHKDDMSAGGNSFGAKVYLAEGRCEGKDMDG